MMWISNSTDRWTNNNTSSIYRGALNVRDGGKAYIVEGLAHARWLVASSSPSTYSHFAANCKYFTSLRQSNGADSICKKMCLKNEIRKNMNIVATAKLNRFR